MENLLEIKNLSIELYKGRRQPSVKLVEGVNLNVKKRQTVGIVGESGCGKSISCAAVMGLLSYPLSVGKGSSIRFQNADGKELEITTLSRKALTKLRGQDISMIFQEPMTALDPMFTIGQQMCEALQFHHPQMGHNEMRDRCLEMLEKVRIPRPDQVFRDYPHHLSGGMLQRVMIAIALINDPRLLIADEPTTALDVTTQAQILDLMNALRESYEASVMMITHDLGVIAETCEEVVVYYAGQIVEQGSADEIFHAPAHPYTRGLLQSVRSLDSDERYLYAIKGVVPAAGHFPAGCRFADRCTECTDACRQQAIALKDVGGGHLCRCCRTAL